MQPRSAFATPALLLGILAALGCHADPTAPTNPDPAASDASLAAAPALAFWQVSGGELHTCAIAAADSSAWCWGTNGNGQLGTGSIVTTGDCVGAGGPFPCSTRPVRVAAGARKFRWIASASSHTCAVTTDFHAWCWGNNSYGQLGVGVKIEGSASPVAVIGGLRFRQVDAGGYHTCGVTYPDNRLFCWGDNGSGQLGDGTLTPRWAPVSPLGGLTVRQVATGDNHSCALTTLNRAYCWGSNKAGELGDSTTARRTKPVKVVSGHAFRQIDAGTYRTCAVTTDARAFCWGSGELGNGKTQGSNWPRPVSGNLSVARVTMGRFHTCAETTSKQAYCWGSNTFGQIGNGQLVVGSTVLAPVPVVGGLAVAQMSAGNWHTCAKTTSGVGYCWGYDFFAQLGDGRSGSGTSSPVPVRVAAPQ